MRSPSFTANPTLLDLWRPGDYRRGACPRRKYLGEESSGDGLDLHIHAPGRVMRFPANDVPRDAHGVLAGTGGDGDEGASMKQGAFLLVTSSIFALIALLHALRLLYGWSVTIGEWAVPVWVSALGFLIAGYLACQGFILKTKQG